MTHVQGGEKMSGSDEIQNPGSNILEIQHVGDIPQHCVMHSHFCFC